MGVQNIICDGLGMFDYIAQYGVCQVCVLYIDRAWVHLYPATRVIVLVYVNVRLWPILAVAKPLLATSN